MPHTTTQPIIPRFETEPQFVQGLDVKTGQADLFRSIEDGGAIELPSNFVGSEGLVLPSLRLESPRGNEAHLVTLYQTDKKLGKFYDDAVKSRKGMDDRITDMTFEAAVRLLDTSGADGLHHIHGSNFPNTVYFNAKVGNGVLANVYMTQLGEMPDKSPVLAMITATRDKKSEYAFFRYVGAGSQKGRYNH